MSEPRWIRIDQLAVSGLPMGRVVELAAIALTELGIAESLKIIHGDGWEARYLAIGPIVVLDADLNPVIRSDAVPRG
jgi:hypothetical protein